MGVTLNWVRCAGVELYFLSPPTHYEVMRAAAICVAIAETRGDRA